MVNIFSILQRRHTKNVFFKTNEIGTVSEKRLNMMEFLSKCRLQYSIHLFNKRTIDG